MGFCIRHEINALIDDEYIYILGLIESYPKLSKDWRQKQCNRFKIIAKNNSEGDLEIKRDIYRRLEDSLDNSYFEDSIFNNSMFLMIFSSFEGIVNKIMTEEKIVVLTNNGKTKNEPKVEEIISQIETSKNFSLSDESQNSFELINNLRKLRNYIAHNNGCSGSKKEETINGLIRDIKCVENIDGVIAIKDLQFILDIHKKMHSLLKELSNKLGYKNRLI